MTTKNLTSSSLNPKPPHCHYCYNYYYYYHYHYHHRRQEKQHVEKTDCWPGNIIIINCVQARCCCRRRQRRQLNSRAGLHDDGGETSRQITTKINANNHGTTEGRRRCFFKRASIKQREGQDQQHQHQEHYPKRRE